MNSSCSIKKPFQELPLFERNQQFTWINDSILHRPKISGNVLESVNFRKISILTRNSLWLCFVPQNDQRSFFFLGSLESLNHISKRCPDVPNTILYCFRLQWHAWVVRRSYCWNSFESQKKVVAKSHCKFQPHTKKWSKELFCPFWVIFTRPTLTNPYYHFLGGSL